MKNKTLQNNAKQITKVGKTWLVLVLLMWSVLGLAQNQPPRDAQSIIYFDLAAGNVTINASSYSGKIYTTTGGTPHPKMLQERIAQVTCIIFTNPKTHIQRQQVPTEVLLALWMA